MESTQETLFCKSVPINIKRGSTQSGQRSSPLDHQDDFYAAAKRSLGSENSHFTHPTSQRMTSVPLSEKKGQSITVQIILASKNATQMKVLEIQLTDENDPFFVYNLSITEEEFHALKSEQSLLIDFLQFPSKFIELLEACISSYSQTSPKYLCTLVSDPSSQFGLFSIVETNTFRNINHLSLQFVPGNDSTIKQYLASLVKDYKSEIASLKYQLESSQSNLTGRLDEAQSKIVSLTGELDGLRISQSQQETHFKLENASQIARLKENYAQERESMRSKYETELRAVTNRFEQEIKSITDKLSSLSVTHSSTMQHVQSLESALLSANKQNEAYLRQISELQKENERLSLQKHQSESEAAELKAALSITKDRLSELERRERETGDSGRQMQDRVLFLQEQKAKLEETVNLYKNQQSHQEEAIRKASDEINKANEIIRRLQAELKSAKGKLKLKNVVTLQQEKLLEERQSNMDVLQKDLDTLKDSVAKKNEEINSLQQQIQDLDSKLAESKSIIEDNNHVIEWLHKQLNEEALHGRGYTSNIGGMVGYRPIDFDKYTSEKRTESTSVPYKPRLTSELAGRRVPSSSALPDPSGRPPRSPTRLTTPSGKPSSPSRAHFHSDAISRTGRLTSPSMNNAAMSNSYVATTHLPGHGSTGKNDMASTAPGVKSSYFS